MMQGELQATEHEETPKAAPLPSIAELEALLAEERRKANSDIFALHRQITELTNQTLELERLQKSALEASERVARLEEELAAQRELSTALSELRRWQAELSKRRDDALASVAVAREALERYRIRKAARSLVALERSAAYPLLDRRSGTSTSRKMTVAIYADVNPNLIDGSTIRYRACCPPEVSHSRQ